MYTTAELATAVLRKIWRLNYPVPEASAYRPPLRLRTAARPG